MPDDKFSPWSPVDPSLNDAFVQATRTTAAEEAAPDETASPDQTVEPEQVALEEVWLTLPESFRERVVAEQVVAVAVRREEDDEDDDEADADAPGWAGRATCALVDRFGTEVWLFSGDVHLTAAQWAAVAQRPSADDGHRTVVVRGNLTVDGALVDDCYLLVTGMLVCDRLRATSEEYDGIGIVVGEETVARQYAYLQRQLWGCGCGCMDHDHPGWPGKLTTPRLFCYWVAWQDSDLRRDTALHLIVDAKPDLLEWPEWYSGCEDYNVLRPECVVRKKGDHGEDGRTDGVGRELGNHHWDIGGMDALLDAGESIIIDGYDPTAVELVNRSSALRREERYKEAFVCAKEAAERWPGYYTAWLVAGFALQSAGAYTQAISYFDRAVAVHPVKHDRCQDDALDYGAYCALLLGDWDRVVEAATLSIDAIPRTGFICQHHEDRPRSLPYRLRGEAWLWKGELKKAISDLETAVDMSWVEGRCYLLALAYHKKGNEKKAKKLLADKRMKKADKKWTGPLDECVPGFWCGPGDQAVEWEHLTLADIDD